jgi:hypothetical protein
MKLDIPRHQAMQILRDQVERLAYCHQIAVYECDRPTRARAIIGFDEIRISPIRSLISYATALHELGHILGHHRFSPDCMVRERWAWRWARQNALVWTAALDRQVEEALAWYAARRSQFNAAEAQARREAARKAQAENEAELEGPPSGAGRRSRDGAVDRASRKDARPELP